MRKGNLNGAFDEGLGEGRKKRSERSINGEVAASDASDALGTVVGH